ncbi:baseplate assembly protein [Novosphingobium sp. RL4]|uniref:baseplate assembly protein n=1 Tax=Novosphingobium sp. RL4 TaxID=3109595 RepID=UPI002D795DE9|nr:baseplate J/gp47 family protein [Novosphingobium sp. RL4]WRT94297.1 baseplate J/gp47 family protein [Novosphingobium sp. RL4]
MADPTFTAVDLSRLPAPDIIETLDFETMLADAIAHFKSEMEDLGVTIETRDSDPAIKLLQTFTYLAQLLRQRVNDAARAVMPAFAVKGDLDNIAATFGIMRQTVTPADEATGTAAVMESDTEFRRRMVLAPEGYSVAGPEGAYLFHALSADAEVLDATATSPSPGVVLISLLSRLDDGTASQRLIDVVQAYLSADTRRPLTDYVIVQSAQVIPYAVDYDLTTYNGPDGTLVLASSLTSVQAYVDESHRVGRDITMSALFRAAHVEGVQNIRFNAPVEDVAITRTQAPFCTGVAARLAGTNE